jgi:hypothetical protein
MEWSGPFTCPASDRSWQGAKDKEHAKSEKGE